MSQSKLPHKFVNEYLRGAEKTVVSPLLKSIAFIAMALTEKIFVDELFRCPCTDTPTILGWSFFYSSLFFLIPALALYFLSLAQSNGLWTLFMGICRRNKINQCKSVFWCCCFCCVELNDADNARGKKWFEANLKALAVIVMWFAIVLFDGDYGACAVTSAPYTADCATVQRKKVELPFSDDYRRNKQISQIIGEFMIFGVAIVYFLIVCCHRCWYDADYETYVIVDDYMKIKENLIREDITKILEAKLKVAMPELNEKDYFKDAIVIMKKQEDDLKDERHIKINVNEWVASSSSKAVQTVHLK